MADKLPDLNPEPAENPASVGAKKQLPKSKPVDSTEFKHKPASSGAVWPGAFAAFGEAFNRIKQNPEPVYLFVGVYFVLYLIGFLMNGYVSPFDLENDNTAPEGLAGFIFLLALPVYALAAADQKKLTLSQFMKFDVRFFYLIGVIILSFLIWLLSFIALLIPLIWTVAWFFMAQYACVDKSLGPIEALKESKRISEDNKGRVWGLIGAGLLFGILALIMSAIPFIGPVIEAFYTVLVSVASAILYRWLQSNAAPEA